MPTIDRHSEGVFCWVELGTTDQEAAKVFYPGLFEWSFTDLPMGPGAFYTMFTYQGKNVAAAYRLTEEMRGVPPHWMLYIASDDVDRSAAKCTELGGKVEREPFDVFDSGRMAVVQDPTGAMFCIWQAKQHKGIDSAGEPNTFCWADLSSPDPETAAPFYAGVFGWDVEAEKDGGGYMHIKNRGTDIGGMPPAQHYNPQVPPHWLLYFHVTDVDVVVNKAKEMGARTHWGPTDLPSVGRIAILADPQGAVFALFKEAAH